MNDRCGCMREGGDRQCIHSSGHPGLHKWESEEEMLARTSAYEKELADYEEGLQALSQVLGDGGCKVPEEEEK